MAPQPRKQNPQRQPLTSYLRKICRDYPAGAGVLKELLQNADDAGASTIVRLIRCSSIFIKNADKVQRFVLDTRTHPDSPVLVDGLSEYQGAALLAYNDAIFSEEDFESLTSLGDSKKIQDKVATGKFGLGFSSVFNWTDCPSILSGSTLLFLDPHHTWSRAFDPPGGPSYDFPESATDEAMINQLRCFSLFNTEWGIRFNGTIIRIPLRNASQAQRSEISKTETLIHDVQESMDSFASDMGSSGLLFLKSVQRIVLSINDELLNEVEVTNKDDLTGPKQRLRSILAESMKQERGPDFDVYHEVRIRHSSAGREAIKDFGILNLVVRSIHSPFNDNWAESEKLFPWVAVAAPLKNLEHNREMGRFFSTLPLPIPTGVPVHIHGLFSISTDRSRLHGRDDEGVQDHRPKEWNKYLLEEIVPKAWTKLLLNICQTYPTESHFYLWPTNSLDTHQVCYSAWRAVVDQISQNHLPVWFTEVGHVALEDGLLASEETQLKEKTAFREAKLPVIFLVNHLLDEARQKLESRSLRPRTLYECLRPMKNFNDLSRQSKLVLLEVLLREVPLMDLGALEIFPFEDGNFRSLGAPPIFLHRDGFEKTLFTRQLDISIDADELSASASRLLHEEVRNGNQMVRYRTPEDLRSYFLDHIVMNGLSDTILIDADRIPVVKQVWTWILRYYKDQLPLQALGPLWLVPLQGSAFRRLVPLDSSNFVTWFRPGEVNDLSHRVSALVPKCALKILACDALSEEILQFLLSFAHQEPSMLIKDGSEFESFLEFLVQDRSVVQTAPEEVKNSIMCVLRQLFWSRTQANQESVRNNFKSLYLFKAIQWPENARDLSVTRYRTDVRQDIDFIGLSSLVPVPSRPGRVLLDVSNEHDQALFKKMSLLRCMNAVQILEDIVISALGDGSYDGMNSSFRFDVATQLFQNYYNISEIAQKCLSNLAVVPIEKRKDDGSLDFARPPDILNPDKLALRNLYFEDEICLAEQKFYNRFSAVLTDCGMVQCLNERVVLDRIRSYGRKELGFGVVAPRATKLLQMSFPEDSTQLADFTRVVRESKWLPARAPEKSDSLTSSFECRDKSDEPLVGNVWHVLPFKIDPTWRSILGWHDCVEVNVLISQLIRSIAVRDINSIDQTLSYICQHHQVENYAGRLSELNFVYTTEGELVNAANVCRQGVEKLVPYLHVVERRFWDSHTKIMKLVNVPEIPKLGQLKDVQKALESKNSLDELDLNVATELARIWGIQFHEATDGLKLPNDKGAFVEIGGLVFNDAPWLLRGSHDFVHNNISRTIAEQLKIQPLSELSMKGALGIVDLNEDEFYQREEIADGIRDTLDRYTREHTFHEYLANADDCGSATEVNFFFDETSYSTEHLVTKDLRGLQGSSLLIHNNGVFTDKDFEGLKYVGRGSKREDPTTIGKFGRGSQTMYHWTDTPMILSGGHLLILDPLRKHLPFNYRTMQNMPGILVEYVKLKSTCQDQLAPFEGLWGFKSDQDFYNGTIFRFPLRSGGQSSELLESRRCPDTSTTIQTFRKCFDEARLSLLFLRNIATVDFGVKGGIDFEWRVRRGNWPQSGSFPDWANVIVEQHDCDGGNTFTTENWWRVIKDVGNPPTEVQDRHKRTMKNVECGIAALVPQSEEATGYPLQPLKSKFFNCLPLKFESTLPVQIHATFLLSGDRQNIATEETSQDAGSEWNKWLLQEELPQVYLQFLEDIGRKTGYDVYKYFPVEYGERKNLLSNLIQASFWEKISSSRCRLFPVVMGFQDLRTSETKSRSKRTAPNLVAFESAVFDVLEQRDSEALQPLLDGCLDGLVRPPTSLANFITRVPGVKVVTPAMVRSILKSTKAMEHVEKARQKDKKFFDILLSFITPTTLADVDELDRCQVLPLANGTLGTLCLKSTMCTNSGSDKMYFSLNAECRGLFSFASSILSADRGNGKFMEKVLGSGQLNLKSLEKKDISVMLNCKKSWTLESPLKTWLFHLWEFMNSNTRSTIEATEPEVLDLDSLQHFPLLLLRDGAGKETLNSLDYFQNNPVVVHSTIEEHTNLFTELPGLAVVDRRTLPEAYCEAENSLFDPASMNRFLKGITLLALRDETNVTEFVGLNLNESSILILRDIILQGPQAVNLDSSLLDTANALPLWPRISSKPGYLTTKEALVAQNSAFVVSWIEDFHRFAKFSDPHHHLSIDDVQMLQQYVLPDLPKFIDEKNRAPYARLIEAITFSSSLNPEISESNKAGKFVLPLNRYPLAARQDRKLCLAADLFDHDEIVFAAAFRAEAPGRFLMLEVRKYSALWNKLGIRRRESGKFNGPDYLDCLRALEGRLNRLEDQQLTADVERVLYPLCTNDRALSDLNNTTWSTIARLPVFLVNPVSGSELEHRRRRMEILASQSYTICLKDIIRQESAAICWSQTPFALHEPSSFSIQKGGSTGQPTCVMVWQHLAFLAESVQSIEEAEVRGFVGDLERTYRHLHLNPGESKCEFTQPSAALWLNVETTSLDSISLDVLKSSWTSLEYLLLDSPCDARPLMMVRPFLGRFSTLLKYLGCKSLYYPQINSLSPSRSETTFTSVQKLWKEGFLTDVKCEAEGNSIHAHKIVLASQSSYFKAQFGGPWAPVSENKVTSNVIKVEDMTYATLRIVIDFCYDEHHDWAAGIQVGPEDELSAIEDKLDGLLDVLVAADRWLMPNLQAEAELHVMTGIKFFIWPNNVETVKRIAEEANATELTKYCKEYIAGNTEAILLASMSG